MCKRGGLVPPHSPNQMKPKEAKNLVDCESATKRGHTL